MLHPDHLIQSPTIDGRCLRLRQNEAADLAGSLGSLAQSVFLYLTGSTGTMHCVMRSGRALRNWRADVLSLASRCKLSRSRTTSIRLAYACTRLYRMCNTACDLIVPSRRLWLAWLYTPALRCTNDPALITCRSHVASHSIRESV